MMTQDKALREFWKLHDKIVRKHARIIELVEQDKLAEAKTLSDDRADLDELDLLASIAEGKTMVN